MQRPKIFNIHLNASHNSALRLLNNAEVRPILSTRNKAKNEYKQIWSADEKYDQQLKSTFYYYFHSEYWSSRKFIRIKIDQWGQRSQPEN